MKKILIIQSAGEHEKNKHYRECFSFQRAFQSLGYIADVWGFGHNNFNDIIDFNNYDLIYTYENYSTWWLPDLKSIYKPIKLLSAGDAHCLGTKVIEKHFLDKGYNYLVHATIDFVKASYHVWLPHGYDDDLIYPVHNNKTFTLGFCGNYNNRKEIIDELHKKFNLKKDIWKIGEEMVNCICSYKYHFNKNIGIDINYRSFETMGCGAVLITNYNHQYDYLGFEHNKNCLIYNDEKHLFEILKSLNVFDYESLRRNSIEFAKEHTYKQRMKELLNYIDFK